MIELTFDANGDSQDFVGRDGTFIVRRIRRTTQTLNPLVDPETVPFTYFLVCPLGRPLTGGMTLEGIQAAVAARIQPVDVTTMSDDEYDRATNYGAF